MTGAPADEALWRFSLAVYGAPGVAERLIGLQDRHGLDVNLLLFCAWHGASGRGRIDRALLARAEASIADWRRDVTETLRRARRALTRYHHIPGAAPLREAVKQAELEAERAGQRLLVAALPQAGETRPGSERASDATANVALYCELLKVPLEELDSLLLILPLHSP